MAAVMSAFGFIGGPGLVYKFGISSLWMTFACGTGFAYAYWVLGKRMRGMAEVTSVATLPDIARVRFQSQAVRGFLAVGLFIAAVAYLSAQVKGAGLVLSQMLGVNYDLAVFIFFGVTLAYMLVSGMSGSILTDMFQGLIMLIGVFAVIIGFFILTKGEAMSVVMASPKFGAKFVDGIGGAPIQFIIAWALIFFVGTMGQPTMLTKMYSLKSHKGLKTSGILSGAAYAMTSLVWFLVGYGALYVVASGLSKPLTNADDAAFLFLANLKNIYLQGLVMAALFAAIISTASFFVSLAAGALTRDLMGSLGHEIPLDRQVKWGRILTVVITLLAIAFGYFGGHMVAILGTLGWGFFASVTLPTFLIGLTWRRTTKEGILAALIVAIVGNLTLHFLDGLKIFKLPFPYYVLTIALSCAVAVIVSLFTKTAGGKNLPEELEPIFKL